jgi:predicted MFS family arabinose efflux permease
MKRIAALYKASYTGLSPSSWWLSVVMFINRSGTMVVPFMTLYMTQSLGYSISQAGIVMGIFGCGAICGGFIGGRLADRFGFYSVQLMTLLFGGILFIVLGQMRSFIPICITTFLLSIVNESFRPANSIAIAQYSKDDNRTRSYALNRLAINLGWAFGGSLGGFIASHNYEMLFIIDGCTNIGAAILLRLVLSPRRQQASVKQVKEKPTEAVRSAYTDKRYIAFSFFVLLYAYSFFQLFSTIPVYFRRELHLSEEIIGFTMAGNGIMIALFEMVLIFRLEGKRHPLQYIPIGTALVALSYLLFNVLPFPLLVAILSTLVVTVGEMLSMPFMNTYWISRTNEHNRGQYAGLYTVSWALAQVLGPVTGARLADTFGFTALWNFVTIIAVISALGFWLLHRVGHRSEIVIPATK